MGRLLVLSMFILLLCLLAVLSPRKASMLCITMAAWMGVVIALVGIAILPRTYARDLGQWENGDPTVRDWYKNLKQPDYPQYSCCEEADAYWCDDIHVRDGETYCRITDTRPDAELGRAHVDNGNVYRIPPNKLKWDSGNPTGHSVIFLAGRGSAVVCFVQNLDM
jgi:hypothetical protein